MDFDVFFYATLLPLNLASLWLFHTKKQPPVFTLSFIFLVLNFIFIVIPGYYNYRGYGSLDENISIINEAAYWLLYCQGILVPIIIYFVWNAFGFNLIRATYVKSIRFRHTFLLGLCLVYFVYYLTSIKIDFPLLSVFDEDLVASALLRSKLTHGIDSSDISRILSYWRPITKDILFILCLPFFAFGNFFKSIFSVSIFCILTFSLLLHLEKSYALMIIFALIMANNGLKPVGIKLILLSGSIIFLAAFAVTYYFFLGDAGNSISYLTFRLAAQTGYLVPQLEILNQTGFLGLHGYNFGFIGKLLDIEFVDIGQLAFAAQHPDLIAQGHTGSSAGTSLSGLYFSIGFFAIFLYAILLIIIIEIDFNFYKIYKDAYLIKNVHASRICKSFYIYFVCFQSLGVVGGLFSIISLTTILSPPMLLSSLLFLTLFKISIPRKVSRISAL